jgi:two-component system cell cycle response regulator
VIYKPFDGNALEEFLSRYFEVNEVITIEGNVLTAAESRTDKPDRIERYYTRMRSFCGESFEKIASACFEDVIVDLEHAPLRNDKTMRVVLHMCKEAERLGLALRLVGNGELKRILGSITETQHLPVYPSVGEARAEA